MNQNDLNNLIKMVIDYNSKNELNKSNTGYMNSWSDQNEIVYRKWLKQWSENTGVSYNPDDTTYDYRKVYKLNLYPTWQPEHQEFRWPDIGKSPQYQDKYPDILNSMPNLIWDKLFSPYGV